MIAPVATGVIAGLGGHGYPLADRGGREVARHDDAARRWTWPAGSTACRGALDGAGCDALLVTHLTNIRYLTGFTGSAALLLVRPDALTFVTDGRYEEQAAGQLGGGGRRRPTSRSGARSPVQQELVTERPRGIGPARASRPST